MSILGSVKTVVQKANAAAAAAKAPAHAAPTASAVPTPNATPAIPTLPTPLRTTTPVTATHAPTLSQAAVTPPPPVPTPSAATPSVVPQPAPHQATPTVAPPPLPAAPAHATPLASIPGVQTTPTNPANDLRGQTLGVAPTVDRGQLAQNYIKTWDSQAAPKFQADVNTAISNKAALGQLGSGGLRTSLGNLVAQNATDRNAAYSNFYNDALSGSINDAYQNVGIAQQQQQYQTALQNQTFNQNLAGRQQENQEYNDQFNQNYQTNAFNAGRQDTSFNQGVTQQQLQAALQNQGFNQNLATQQQGNATQAQQFGQGLSIAQLQAQLQNQGFNQAATTYQLGSQGNPSSQYQNLANQYGASGQNGLAGAQNTIAGGAGDQNMETILDALRKAGLLGGGALPTGTPILSGGAEIT